MQCTCTMYMHTVRDTCFPYTKFRCLYHAYGFGRPERVRACVRALLWSTCRGGRVAHMFVCKGTHALFCFSVRECALFKRNGACSCRAMHVCALLIFPNCIVVIIMHYLFLVELVAELQQVS